MIILNIPETVCKGVTLGGCPCILVEKRTPCEHGQQSELQTLGVFADNENGHALADALIESINHGKVRL